MPEHEHDAGEPTWTERAGRRAAPDEPGRVIGPYRLMQLLGEGGMGEVWLAEQAEPIRRQVALKLIKRGMDTRRVISRFETERQALAVMDHPSIARVYDAGETDRGRPFFVMEYVHGEPITSYCDRNRLSMRERLRLFAKVCEGVQHAHQKAIIHRDLKPSNVLVTIVDDEPQPKIIDFGVAKAIQARLTERTLFTEQGVMIGTPEYMSPEQAEMSALDVDTRTDVYALGVMLYELLTGTLPFDAEELRSGGFDAVRKKIREDDPSKPSTKVSTLGKGNEESARLRRTDVSGLTRQLRGDLDWITMKALEKDRTRRYASPHELAVDIERHLTDQPVVAGPPSALYRARKFIKRHKLGVSAATLSVLVLVAFAGTMTLQAQRIAQARSQAVRVSAFLTDLFQVSDPSEARGSTITAREILDRGAARIESELSEEPETQAALMATIGKVYVHLGLLADAEPHLERALETRRSLLGEDHPDTLQSMNELGVLLEAQGKLPEAQPLLEASLAGYRRELGDDAPRTLASRRSLCSLYRHQGRLDDAEPLCRAALDGQVRVLGRSDRATLASMTELALLLRKQGALDESERLYRDALEVQRRELGFDHPDTLASLVNLGLLLRTRGKLDESEGSLREALAGYRRVIGDDRPATLAAAVNVGTVLVAKGDLDAAEPFYREALEGHRRVLGEDHPATLAAMNNVGGLLDRQGRLDEAGAYYREALDGLVRVLGEDHSDTLIAMGNLADLYGRQGRWDEAEPLLTEAARRAANNLPRVHYVNGVTLRKLGACRTGLGSYGAAEEALLDAHEILSALIGAEHAQTREVVEGLVELYAAWGKPDAAARWRRELPAPAAADLLRDTRAVDASRDADRLE